MRLSSVSVAVCPGVVAWAGGTSVLLRHVDESTALPVGAGLGLAVGLAGALVMWAISRWRGEFASGVAAAVIVLPTFECAVYFCWGGGGVLALGPVSVLVVLGALIWRHLDPVWLDVLGVGAVLFCLGSALAHQFEVPGLFESLASRRIARSETVESIGWLGIGAGVLVSMAAMIALLTDLLGASRRARARRTAGRIARERRAEDPPTG